MNKEILSKIADTEQSLVNVIGYFEFYEEGKREHSLCAMSFIFEESSFHVVAQENDSFVLYSDGWCGDSEWLVSSLSDTKPWSTAIGKPIFCSWILCNHQGYFDGIQLEFAKNSESKSTVVQLVALGSEVKQREVVAKCSSIIDAGQQSTKVSVDQSSIDFDGVPTHVIDGNTDGRYNQCSATHTQSEVQPWWEVALIQSADIKRQAAEVLKNVVVNPSK